MKRTVLIIVIGLALGGCGGMDEHGWDPSGALGKGEGGSLWMSRHQVAQELVDQGLSDEQASAVIDALHKHSGGEPLMIRGTLNTRGFNGAFFVDNDYWDFDASFLDPQSGQVVQVSDAIRGRYYNGGFAVGLEYKWVIVILTGDVSFHQLDGAIFGRGVGVTVEAGIGIDVQWLPGENRAGHAFVIAPAIGFAGGLKFPKLEFETRSVGG